MNSSALIVGNWKMHGHPKMARELAGAVAAYSIKSPGNVSLVLCPPFVLLGEARDAVAGAKVSIGGQDCAPQAEGAFTGDISAPMLKAAGGDYVILGHSERRTHHKESSASVSAKAAAALEAGLIPIICIGETDEERVSGQAEAVIGRQIAESVPDAASTGDFVLAYEPVWAIGSGKTPSLDDIKAMHGAIAQMAAKCTGRSPEAIHVLYGGSVKAANAADILALPGVAGVLVGGASLKAEEFCAIAAAAAVKG